MRATLWFLGVLEVSLGVASADEHATQYCTTRVAALPSDARVEALERCTAVMTKLPTKTDELRRLAALESWMRARSAPHIADRRADACAAQLAAQLPQLAADAKDALEIGRQNLRREYPTDGSEVTVKRSPGDVMNPF